MLYLILKALHIIFMVSYFAGLFYLVRLFVYYKDTEGFEKEKSDTLREQYVFMISRLWRIITVPAFWLMLIFGLGMLFYHFPNFPLLSLEPISWFYIKILFLLGLFIYHDWCGKLVKKLEKKELSPLSYSTIQLRQLNEIATFILFLVVFTVIFKAALFQYWWQLLLGFIAIVLLITFTVKAVNKNKKSK